LVLVFYFDSIQYTDKLVKIIEESKRYGEIVLADLSAELPVMVLELDMFSLVLINKTVD